MLAIPPTSASLSLLLRFCMLVYEQFFTPTSSWNAAIESFILDLVILINLSLTASVAKRHCANEAARQMKVSAQISMYL